LISSDTSPAGSLDKWEAAVTGSGASHLSREQQKARMSAAAASKLKAAMQRQQDGEAVDSSLVRKGVYELRIRIDGRWYRLLFGRKGDKFVALMLIVKKQNKLDNNDIDTALERLGQHVWQTKS
jgi:putative component of toxin-antitoxin plasmid stabilization module